MLGCGFAWQAQWILHLAKSEQKREGVVAIAKTKGSAKMHLAWQARWKRHFLQRCFEARMLTSYKGLYFGASDLQVD